jgi:hypothetical protein
LRRLGGVQAGEQVQAQLDEGVSSSD